MCSRKFLLSLVAVLAFGCTLPAAAQNANADQDRYGTVQNSGSQDAGAPPAPPAPAGPPPDDSQAGPPPAGPSGAPYDQRQMPPPPNYDRNGGRPNDGRPNDGRPDARNARQQYPPPNSAPVPPTLTVPAGTFIPVRVNQWLSSDKNHPGDTFTAVLDQPLVANGWVVARRGQSIIGRVAVAEKAPRGGGDSRLGLELAELSLVDGQQVPLRSELVRVASVPRSQAGRDVATVGTTTIIGAAIGAIAGRGEGAAIGAGIGAGAGIAGVMATRGKPTVIAPETLLTFRLDAPLEISTDGSQVAFQPVSQSDYAGRDADAYANYPRQNFTGSAVYAPYPVYYPGYCSGWGWYCAPGPYYLGFYGGYGFYGPRFGGVRGFAGRGRR